MKRFPPRLARLLLCALLACSRPAPAAKGGPVGQASSAQATAATSPPAPGVAIGTHGAVSSPETYASKVGLSVLQRGGNAVDAAIAVAFALAVTHPTAGNLGGGGFMLVRMQNGTAIAIDYRETAPAAASRDMYLDKSGKLTHDSLVGPRAAGIPGTVAGLALAHARFGTRAWNELLAPAVLLARQGHALDKVHADDLEHAVKQMRDAGFEPTAKLYLGPDGAPLHAGQLWKQPELGAALERIAKEGPRVFYEGSLAESMVEGVRRLGGIWTLEDLRGYRALERAPLAFDYRGYHILSMPPPSSGGIVLRQLLAASELLSMQQKPWRSAEAFHLYIEAARRAFADRNELLGDPDFVKVPTEKLVSLAYIAARMKDIDPAHATPSERIHGGMLPPESSQTTHFSVIDAAGNAVANTYTLNTGFGAKVAIPGTGILLNDEMDDFAAKPGSANAYGLVQSAANAIAPGKRMLSSMTPTIVVDKDGKLRAVVGTPGGPTIISTVAQILRAMLDYGRPLDEAVRAPRLHHQWKPDKVTLEPAFEPEIERGLRALGHNVVRGEAFGHANCIEVNPQTHELRAVADVSRRGGSALAY